MGPLHPKRPDYSNSGTGSAQGDPARCPEEDASDFTFIALWMAGSLAGVMTAALISQATRFRALMRRLGLRGPAGANASGKHKSGPKHRGRPSPEEALPMLADAIIGCSKSAVAKVFGPPHSAIISSRVDNLKPATFWLADTWYYPLPRNAPLALAIRFTDDLARSVEFIRPPVG
jgi:hypothetical protein